MTSDTRSTADDPLHAGTGREAAQLPATAGSAPTTAARAPAPPDPPQPARSPPAAPRGTWLLAATAAIATFGWLFERRRRKRLESEKDSVLWAQVGQSHFAGSTVAGAADGADPAEGSRESQLAAIGENPSRREATLIDLHELSDKLSHRRKHGNTVPAILMLQQHLVDFRYTSPWVFLELRELYKELGWRNEWEIVRRAFRQRFGQNAPAWEAPSSASRQLVNDPVADELAREWPRREARMVVLRWMLGDPEVREKCSGPPLLGLGVYRDLMQADALLDQVLDNRTTVTDSLR